MSSRSIRGIVVEIGGDTSGLSKALSETDKKLRATQSELAQIDKALKLDPSNVTLLAQRQDVLKDAISETSEKLKALEENQEKADKAFAANADWVKQYEPIRKQIEQTSAALEVLKKKQDKIDEQYESGKISSEKYDAFRAEIERTEQQLKELKKEKKELDNTFEDGHIDAAQYREYQREVELTRSKLKDLNTKLEETEAAADKAESGITDLGEETSGAGKSAENAAGGFSVMKGALAELAADGIKSAAEGMKELATESEKASNSFRAQTGASAAEMENFNSKIEEIYSENYGEGLEDIADAMAVVKQSAKNADPENIKELTEQALILRDTFNFDINESMRAANMLMDQFGISGDEAFNLIVQGAQSGLDKNGDLLDSINEYGVHYRQLGYTAEEFFNSLANGTDAGTFSVDKLGDAMKEFGIRVKDTTTSTTEGFELIGLDADEMRKSFSAGGESAQKATEKTLAALFSMDDAVKQNQAGVDLFGTMWEDLGIDGVKALTNVSGSADMTADSLNQIKEIKYSDTESELTALGRSIKTEILSPIANEVMPTVKGGVEWASENLPLIKTMLTEIGIVFAGMKINSIVNSASAAMKVFITQMAAGTATAGGLSAALKTLEINPIVLGLTAVTGAAVLVSGAIDNATDNIDECGDSMGGVTAEAQEFRKRIEEVGSAVGNQSKKTHDATAESQANADAILAMKKRLYELDDAQNISNESRSEMQALVNQLNEEIPDLNLALDEQTGHLKNQRGEVDNLVESYTKQAKAAAAQEQLTDLYKNLFSAQKNYNEAKATYDTMLANGTDKESEAWHNAVNNFNSASVALHTVEDDISYCNEIIADNTDSFLENGEAIDGYTQNVIDNQETAKATLQSLCNDSESLAKQHSDGIYNITEETQQKINELVESYSSAVSERTDQIAGSLDIFKEFQQDSEVTAQSLMDNMQSNLDAMTTWSDGLGYLVGQDIDEGLIQKLRDAGPASANEIRAMCEMSDEQLQTYSDMYTQYYGKAAENAQTEMSGMLKDNAAKIQELIEGTEEQAVPLADAYKYIANMSANGYIEGLDDNMDRLYNKGREMAFKVSEGTEDAAEIESPSKLMRRDGVYFPEGLAGGIDDKMKILYEKGREMAFKVSEGTQDAADRSYTLDLFKNYKVKENMEYVDAGMSRIMNSRAGRIDGNEGETFEISDMKNRQAGIRGGNTAPAVFNLYIDGRLMSTALAPYLDVINGANVELQIRGGAVW